MGGGALRWYIQLDPEIAGDWSKLQRAMMDQWPGRDSNVQGASSSMPTPAAAPEPGAAQGSDIIRPTSSVSVNSIKIGYIRVSSPGAGVLYLSAMVTNVSGRLAIGTCTSRSQALVVQFAVGCVHNPCSMVILSPTYYLNSLAIAQNGHGPLGAGSIEWALLVPFNSQQSGYNAGGLVQTAIWSVCPVDNSIRAFWSAAGSEYRLTSLLASHSGRLVFVSNVNAFRAKFTVPYTDADLVFEER
ncbi:hypothetical protein M407DRAFT_244499 [Tulasnella calospora MUT 4182]|uniref:Uncharacterized protein n=1 Tax=Tulasnella calospora MUT 4182 TaxID=1051891 RepID=A0A0C3Q5E3_9AGAM|nr:hypothetical protein M407DRAFT_244499 [Tulasnella calospora MUT 4182]